jgi:PAS domain S-box-containing protein
LATTSSNSGEKQVTDTPNHRGRFFELSRDLLCTAGFDGYFKELNPSWERVLGYTVDELRAQPYVELVHPDDREATLAEAAKLTAGGDTISFENRYRCKDGSWRWILWSARMSAEDQLIFAVATDITERKRAESERASAQDHAIRASRLKNEFLSRMSHELRTPLNAILGFAQLLEMDELSGEQHESVEQILRGGRHLLGLINEVLDISRIETGKLAMSPEAVSVHEAIEETVALIRPLAAERHITIQSPRAEACSWNVRADHQRLKQVLLNLASNAVKYNVESGTITVWCDESPEGRVRIGFSDSGPGIPLHRRDRLFNPFDRLGAEEGEVEGTGLGLALSKGLTELMGGTLTVEAGSGEGTTFIIELTSTGDPLASHPESAPNGSRRYGAGFPTSTVIYVEDNPSNLRLVERLLSRRGDIRLVTAPRGDLVEDLVRQHRPDLVLLDLHLPGQGGEEVLRCLQADSQTAGVPVVIVSADATPGEIERLLAAGARDYLTKPLDVARFLAVVDESLEGAHRP